MRESPVFALSAAPRQSTSFRDFFGRGGPRELLEHPGELRYAGWDLSTGDQARIVRGEFLEVGTPDWKLVQLYEDGTLIARVPGDDNFLAWASTGRRPFWEHPKLNPLALIEFVYSFVILYGRLLTFLNPAPLQVCCRAELRHLISGDARVYLVPHGLDTMMWMTERVKHFAPASVMQREQDVDGSSLLSRPERVAYVIVERVYTWFGATPEEIPYVAESAEGRVVDVELIKAGGKRKQ